MNKMTSTMPATGLTAVAITGCFLLGIQASAQSQKPNHDPSHTAGTYSVSKTGEPLAELLLQLQQAFLAPINYEEIAYENPSELRSLNITTLKGPKKLLVTPQVDFSATLTEDDSTPYLALHSVLAQYNGKGLYGADSYQIIQQANHIDVLPVQVRGANASMHKVVPVTSYPVTFPAAERTVEDTLVLLFQEVAQASGKQVSLLYDPFSASNPKVTIGANAELPGDVLATIGQSLGATLSYHCLYDASDSSYTVNIYPVIYSIKGNLYNNPAPGTPQPGNSSFFTRDHP
jgi:hypothetical protein